MIRTFIAISPPDDVTDALMDAQDDVRNARWVDEANLHLTLAFLGERSPSELTELDSELGRIRMEPFDLTVAGVGAFGGGKPHTLYAGIAPSPPLSRLAAKIDRLTRELGWGGDRRKFRPHITLGRCGGGVIPAQALEWTRYHARLSPPPFPVHSFAIHRSDLGPGAPHYTELVSYPLLAPSD